MSASSMSISMSMSLSISSIRDAQRVPDVPVLGCLNLPCPGARHGSESSSDDSSPHLSVTPADAEWSRDKMSLPSPAQTSDSLIFAVAYCTLLDN